MKLKKTMKTFALTILQLKKDNNQTYIHSSSTLKLNKSSVMNRIKHEFISKT